MDKVIEVRFCTQCGYPTKHEIEQITTHQMIRKTCKVCNRVTTNTNSKEQEG